MNWEQLRGKWSTMRGDVRKRWGKLTDDDVEQTRGDRDKLEGKLRERYGIAKEEAHRWVDEFLAKL